MTAPELLQLEMPLVLFIEGELLADGYRKDSKEYKEMFDTQLSFFRMWGMSFIVE